MQVTVKGEKRKSKEKLEKLFAETKNELKAMNSTLHNADERISDLEDRIKEIIQPKRQTESQIKNKSNIRGPWDNMKCANPCTTMIPEGEERERGLKNVFEEM